MQVHAKEQDGEIVREGARSLQERDGYRQSGQRYPSDEVYSQTEIFTIKAGETGNRTGIDKASVRL